MKLADGDVEFDCLAILDELNQRPPEGGSVGELAGRWNLLWNDLKHKARGLSLESRRRILSAALISQLPSDLRPSSGFGVLHGEPNIADPRREADVVILCVLEEEFNAVLVAFGINQRKKLETESIFGHRFYNLKTVRNRYFGRLNIWVGLIGEARNVVCANFCRDVFEAFRIKHCCLLVGIAAGNRKKLKLGHVIAAQGVFDDAGGRAEPKKLIPRPRPYHLPPAWSEMLKGFNPQRKGWLKGRNQALQRLKETGSRVPASAEKLVPIFTTGIIVAGEQLRRDNPLPQLVERYGDQIMAIEMEGSGFAATCDRKDIRWLIFRGVSDYGDMKKRDTWQPMAALHAGLAARSFVEHELRPTGDPQL
ncbi:MAG: hypothetical protein AB7K64_12890 [Variibacter sp.]